MNRTAATLPQKQNIDTWIRSGLACTRMGHVSFIVQDNCLIQVNSVEVIPCGFDRTGGGQVTQKDDQSEIIVTDPEIRRLLDVIASVQYGSVTDIIQNSKIVQIEKM